MNEATCLKSSAVKPLDVSAGVPNLTPDGFRADLSPGHVFLLAVIDNSSSINSTLDPVRFCGLKSTNNKCVSVPSRNDDKKRIQEPFICELKHDIQVIKRTFWKHGKSTFIDGSFTLIVFHSI